MLKYLTFLAIIVTFLALAQSRNFALNGSDFLLDGQPFQILSGEIHYARVPHQYWRHRIQMAKAMGLNTIATYIFWNFHERQEGVFDFESPEKNLAHFIQIVHDEGMYFLLRPGPYTCAEWDMGGLPFYLLQKPGLKLRTNERQYMYYAERYIRKVADIARELQITRGGPILMVQIENEYGSYGNDKIYLNELKEIWRKNGIEVPFYTADGAWVNTWDQALSAGSVPDAALGLDSGTSEDPYIAAEKLKLNVPMFSSETYPGWLTHWTEPWAGKSVEQTHDEIKFILEKKKSLNFYVIHGGTNFEFWAGANDGGKGGYIADVTSYDYDSPINEQGSATKKFMVLRDLISSFTKTPLPDIPDPIPLITIPKLDLKPYASVWDNLPKSPVGLAMPGTFEQFNQRSGFILYKSKLVSQHNGGALKIVDLHDFATVFSDQQFVGYLNRSEGVSTLNLPAPASSSSPAELEILVEAMGRINFGPNLDYKGITNYVTVNNMVMMNWEHYLLPMDPEYISNLKPSSNFSREGVFHRASFTLANLGDTYIDVKDWSKGIVWVNGNNLGRYWNVGPQTRLYCPQTFLKNGDNEIVIFDLLEKEGRSISGEKSLKPDSERLVRN